MRASLTTAKPIPGWQPYETDPIVRRIDSHGTEYNIPFYDIMGRGQRYLNPLEATHHHLRGRHPTEFILTEAEEPREPDSQRIGIEGGAKSMMDILAYGYSGYDEDYRRYILEKSDMEAHRFALKNCAGVENDVLACIAEEGACADTYAELLTCAAIRLFPEVTAELAQATPEYIATEEYVQRKNELIRNTVSAFLRRDRYYTTKQMDFYRRRVAHCALLDHVDIFQADAYQNRGFLQPSFNDNGIPTFFTPAMNFGHFAESPRGVADLRIKPGIDDQQMEFMWNKEMYFVPAYDDSAEENEEIFRDEDFELAMAKCVIPGICPKPLDEWVHCITAAEGQERHCTRPYKRLLSCLYNFQFYAFSDEDPYAVDVMNESHGEYDEENEVEEEHEEEETYSEPNPSTDLGAHTGLFRTGLYRVFHHDPNTIPLEELEEDHRLMRKQIARLEYNKKKVAERGYFEKVGKL